MEIYVVKTPIKIEVGVYEDDESNYDVMCIKYISDNEKCPTERNSEKCVALILNCGRTNG
jgi:hypothetical protein